MDASDRQAKAEAELAAVREEATQAEIEASEKRVETPGWPIELEDGSEVMVVEKRDSPGGIVVVAEDGTEYAPVTGNPVVHEKVGGGRRRSSSKSDES